LNRGAIGGEADLCILAVDGDDLEEGALAAAGAAPASDQLALIGGGRLLVEDGVRFRGAGGELQRRDRAVLGADCDVAIADRGAVDGADPTFRMPVVGIFNLRG